jgi:hypothetical protein
VRAGRRDRKLSEAEVYSVRKRYKAGDRLVALAAEYGVTQGAMSNIIRGLTYCDCKQVPPVPWGIRNDCKKLNAEQVRSARMRYENGQARIIDLVGELGVTKDVIRKAIRRKTFKWVS